VVEIAASDGVNVFSKNLTVNVADVNDPPTIIGLSSTNIRENEKRDSVVAELVVADEDAGQSVRCVVVDNKQFSLQKNLLVLVGDIDYETVPKVQLRVTCMDDGIPSLYASKTFDINIIDSEDNIGDAIITKYPLYENVTKGQVVATIKNATFVSRNPDFMMVGSNLIYVGKGVNYEETRRIYVLLDGVGGTISLTFDVIDVFEPPIGLEFEIYMVNSHVIGDVFVIGQEEQDEYKLMLQNHLDLFALREKTVVSVVDHVPPGDYTLNFIVNEEFPFSLELTITESTTTILPTTRKGLYTVRISDDENIGTTMATIPNAKELKCSMAAAIIALNANTGRVYTVGVPSALNITTGKYVCAIDSDVTLIVEIYDGCYDAPCGNNPCIDTFKSHVCNCLNGQVGEKCDGISNLEAAKTNASADDISKSALIGIVIGVLSLVAIILILIVVVFKKPTNKTFAEKYEEEMMTNPIFVSPTNRSIVIVPNAAYDYLNHNSTMSLDNPIYNQSMYAFSNMVVPQLPLKMCQKDMVRSLASEEASELYGNVAEAKNVVIHDLNV
jgi:hypothetical protein